MKVKALTIVLFFYAVSTFGQEPLYDIVYFENSPMAESFFYSKTEYSAPSWVKNKAGKLPVSDSLFFTPGNALQINYVSRKNGKWEVEIQYKNIRGQDHYSAATDLVFRLYVSTPTSIDELPSVALGGVKGSRDYVPLKKFINGYRQNSWLKCIVPLKELVKDSAFVPDRTFVAFRQNANDGREHSLFIDQLEMINNASNVPIASIPQLTSAIGFEKHVDISWETINDTSVKYVKIYRSRDNKNFYPVGIQSPFMSRYADFTDTTGKEFFYRISLLNRDYEETVLSNAMNAVTKPMNDEELLDMVQEAHFRYYWEGAEKNSGLALENIHGRRHMIATGASGFGIMALLVGAERKFITRDQLVQRLDKIVTFLERAEKFHGAFPHFIDGTTGKVVAFFGSRDNGADLVETSFLAQGLLSAKQYFNPAIAEEKTIIDRIDKIWKAIEWSWFRKDAKSKFLTWHWSPDQGWIINHKLIGWNETLITYILAICSPTHPVPADLYYSGWASQSEEAQKYRAGWGQTKEGSMYTNGNTYYGVPLKVGVSNGGPLFFVHYSFLGLDPHKFSDAYTNYFDNNANIAKINYRYCIENPKKNMGYGPDAWGLTASDGLWNYQADEPVQRQDHGKITPTGALASFPYTPAESMAALKNYYRNYGKFSWGEFGFYDAFNLNENWRSEIFMGLNQGPIAVMIENYRTGLIWNLFMKNAEIGEGLKKIQMIKP